MTGETTNFVYVTYIVSTPEKVFEAIIRRDIARRYWAHENVSDWQSGSKWEHVGCGWQGQSRGQGDRVHATQAPCHHLGRPIGIR